MKTYKTAFITGATSGIGMATAQLFAQNGYRLVLTGRRQQRLEALQNELNKYDCPSKILCFDIRDKLACQRAWESLEQDWKTIDVLINNAGLAAGLDPIDKGNTDDWDEMVDTNVKGLLYITRLIVPGMVERKQGHIINLSSIAGKEAYENGNVYCATKHAVQALTQGMRIDLVKHGIKVSSICPGAVDTEFSLVRFKGDTQKAADVYKGFTPLYAEDIAETILFVANRPPHVNIDDVLIMPTRQAFTRTIHRDNAE